MTETPDLDQHPIVTKLRAWEPEAIAEALFFRGETTLVVPREWLVRVARYLATEADLNFKLLADVSSVDRFPVEPRFELNYHMVSLSRRERLRLRVWVSGRDPVVDSVTSIWPTANWHEREVFDLFGVRFAGHPDLRRIVLPEEWEGFPLRKDFPVEGPR